MRHGVLNVAVANSALLEELVAFQKAKLVATLRASVPGTRILDIQFRLSLVAFNIKHMIE